MPDKCALLRRNGHLAFKMTSDLDDLVGSRGVLKGEEPAWLSGD